MSQFIDHVQISVRSGDGGNGVIAWRREKYEPLGGPAGGNGGRGGHVYIEATNDLTTLVEFRFKANFEADHGERGRSKNQHGKQGKDLVIRVPVGTLVKDQTDGHVVADLIAPGQKALVAEGGRGGRGNTMMATSTRRAPYYCEPGERGVDRKLELELKLLADVGLIGLPNAGKSTLLSVVSKARPKIANYPFTTLEPNLGVAYDSNGKAFVVADIPGLVEGASRGVGLGHDFLRHIERTRLLVHMVDSQSETIEEDIKTILNELDLFSDKLKELPRLVALNKTDLMDANEADALKQRVEKFLKKQYKGKEDKLLGVHLISAQGQVGTRELIALMAKKLDEIKPAVQMVDPELIISDEAASERPSDTFEVMRKKGVFFITGHRVEKIVEVTNLKEPESLAHMFNVLRAMGVVDALLHEGARQGSEIVVNGITFSFGDHM
ncbi:MAG: GTPase ObgE [Candidatus Melainabacteria bacterium]|jgi:GTP-binding protein|nr:GTPase ObgE [Candidatus Melainabacteria bacterium]